MQQKCNGRRKSNVSITILNRAIREYEASKRSEREPLKTQWIFSEPTIKSITKKSDSRNRIDGRSNPSLLSP